jgi:hypothetical protein
VLTGRCLGCLECVLCPRRVLARRVPREAGRVLACPRRARRAVLACARLCSPCRAVRTFLTSSRARLRRARPSGLRPGSRRGTREHRGSARAGVRTEPVAGWGGGHGGDSGAGGLPRPAGREPSGRGAATRSAGPHPQAGSSRSNARADAPRPRELAVPSSSRRTFSRRAKITV